MQTLKNFKPLTTNDIFEADAGLQQALSFVTDDKEKERLFSILTEWERKIPQWDEWANEAARPENFPRIEKYDRVGNRIEKVILPMETKAIRREVVEGGIFENQTELEKFTKIYLLAQIGESGVTCPLACTDGLIRAVEILGSNSLKKEYLSLLRSSEYPLAGAQFVTEQSGGSDVGAIEGTAKKDADGTWRITAEKWYCSAFTEFFLLAARPEGAPEGTKGIAIFFVPRVIQDGEKTIPNHLSIRRLKDKFGTQSLPTAECDFEGSVAYLLGKEEEGFHNLMNYILNVSRIHNAANCLAYHRRSFAEGRNYAAQREAFGNEIINYPLIQEYLLNSLSELTARRNLFFSMLNTIDDKGLLPKDKEQRLWQRFMINLLKYRTAFNLTEKIKESILVFGANGVMQDFTIVSRLLRDSLIAETWEGPHNILCLQMMRDSQRFDFFGCVQKAVSTIIKAWPENTLSQSRKIYLDAVKRGESLIQKDKLADRNWVQTHAKRIVNHVANLLEIGNLVKQGVTQKNNHVLLMASYLCHQDLTDSFSGFESPVVNNLSSIGEDLIWEKGVEVDLAKY